MANEKETGGGGAVVVDPLGGLQLEPAQELKFKGPFDDYVTVALTIRNPTNKRIAFKIKTTAPKRYCVKPNSGVLDSSQSMKVNVLLQPFNYDPNEKNKHKFMVQYLYLNETEMSMTVNDILNMWKDVPTSRLLDLKLKCVFEFTEAEQQRLPQLTPQSNDTLSIQSSSRASSNISSQDTISSQQSAKTAASTLSSTSQRSNATSASVAPSATSNKQQQVAAAAAAAPGINSSTIDSSLNNTSLNDFDSTAVRSFNKTTTASPVAASSVTSAAGAAKLDRTDNLSNELKLARQENEQLKKENSRLKEEEARLRRLALQSPSTGVQYTSSKSGGGGLDDLLNNRLLILVFVLVAIIFYLLLFR